MIFNRHSNLPGEHAFLSASKYQWLTYTDEQLNEKYTNSFAPAIGTALHALAKTLIDNRIKVAKSDKKLVLVHLIESGIPRGVIDIDRYFDNFARYVNDCVGYAMATEVILYYSDNCFGTADAICMRNGVLRISDYKSGMLPAKMEQLMIYAALFFLEYKEYSVEHTAVELNLYQGDEVLFDEPPAEEIKAVMQRIIDANKVIAKRKEEG